MYYEKFWKSHHKHNITFFQNYELNLFGNVFCVSYIPHNYIFLNKITDKNSSNFASKEIDARISFDHLLLRSSIF